MKNKCSLYFRTYSYGLSRIRIVTLACHWGRIPVTAPTNLPAGLEPLCLLLCLRLWCLCLLLLWWAMAAPFTMHTHAQHPRLHFGEFQYFGGFLYQGRNNKFKFPGGRVEHARRSKAAPTAHSRQSPTPITASTRTFNMAGIEAPPSASDISNALANGQDRAEPFQKRRRKSSGNGADSGDDAHDRSGRDQPEIDDQGTLGTRGRDGAPLEGMGPEGVHGWLWMPNLCGHFVGIAGRIRTSALTITISKRESKRGLSSSFVSGTCCLVHLYNNSSICISARVREAKATTRIQLVRNCCMSAAARPVSSAVAAAAVIEVVGGRVNMIPEIDQLC